MSTELTDSELATSHKLILGMIFDSSSFRWVSAETWDLHLFLDSYSKHFNPSDECAISSFDFLTTTSTTGWGLIVSSLPDLCHICNAEVHSTLGVMSPSLLSCLISLHSYVEKLQRFIKSPWTWLQKPFLPEIQLQDACKTFPVTMDKAVWSSCGGSLFLKLW